MKKKSMSRLLFAAAALACAWSLSAQTPAPAPANPPAPRAASTGGRSAHETVSQTIDGARVIVVYGRPNTKDPRSGEMRKIWGTLVPFDKIWRTGSDEA